MMQCTKTMSFSHIYTSMNKWCIPLDKICNKYTCQCIQVCGPTTIGQGKSYYKVNKYWIIVQWIRSISLWALFYLYSNPTVYPNRVLKKEMRKDLSLSLEYSTKRYPVACRPKWDTQPSYGQNGPPSSSREMVLFKGLFLFYRIAKQIKWGFTIN